MPALTPLTRIGRMSSAQPGSMPDTNTELSPFAQARSMASVTGAGVLGGWRSG